MNMTGARAMTDTGSMADSFAGFPAEAFSWFAGLEADNSKPYFTAQRAVYERSVRAPLDALLEQLAGELGGQPRLFRQQRDIRFSADKSPYKTRTYGVIGERPDHHPPLYAELSSGGLFAGAGYHALAADQLARFRDAVADDVAGSTLEAIVTNVETAGLEVFGEALKSAPRGFERDHPRIRLLRHKGLFAGSRLAPGPQGISSDAAVAHARDAWAACEPLNAWLAQHVGASELPPRPRFGRR